MGLPPDLRLRNSADFRLVILKGKRVSDKFASVYALQRRGSCCSPRYGLSVPKRVGRAVERNLVKRRLREILRSASCENGWDVVVLARQATKGADFWTMYRALLNLLKRSGAVHS